MKKELTPREKIEKVFETDYSLIKPCFDSEQDYDNFVENDKTRIKDNVDLILSQSPKG